MRRRLTAPALAGLLALAWFGFWLWGQRFYDDDYTRWLNPGRQLGWGELTWQLLRPFPPDWGFLDRPGVMASFKLSDSLFGPVAWPLFAARAVLAAALVGLLFAAARELASRAGAEPRRATVGAALAALLFATSEPVFASLAWASDSDLVAQLAVALALLIWLAALERQERRWPLLLLLLAVAFLGHKTKGTAKIVPLVLIGHLAWTARDRVRALAPVLAVLLVVLVPWGRLFADPLPFLVDFGGDGSREWFYWRSANAESFTSLVVGGGLRAWPFGAREGLVSGLLEVLSPYGLTAIALALVVGLRRLLGGSAGGPTRLLLVWLALGLLLFSGYPHIPDHLLSRYLAGFLVPLSCLAGAAVGVGLGRSGATRGLAIAAGVALLLQAAAGFGDTSARKRSWACQVTVTDLARQQLEEGLRGATIGLLDLPDTGYVATGSGNRYETISSTDPNASARLLRLTRSMGPVRLVTTAPLSAGSGWDLERHVEAPAVHRLTGPPLGRCERFVYRP